MTQAVRQEKITIVVNGVSYTGDRAIKGTRSLSQSITYNGITEPDGDRYTLARKTTMDAIAQLILAQIVTGRVMPRP